MPALFAYSATLQFVRVYFPIVPPAGAALGAACRLPPIAGPWALPFVMRPVVFWLTRAPRTLDFVDTRPVVPVVVATLVVPVDTPTPTRVPPQPGPQPQPPQP